MEKAEITHLVEVAKEAALVAGKAVMEIYQSGEFATVIKKDESPVTNADRRAHALIIEYLKHTNIPVLSEEDRRIDFNERKKWGWCWLVDPLDGTKEYIQKNGEFTINIALVNKNVAVGGVIYAPCRNSLYVGSNESGVYKIENEKHTQIVPLAERPRLDELLQKEHVTVVASRSHWTAETEAFVDQFPHVTLTTLGSSLKFMLLIENQADIYPRLGQTMEWDTAAAHAILNATNRGVYHLDIQSELTYNKPNLCNPFFVAF